MAAGVKGTVKIAYWDTEQRGRPPSLLGSFQGTPTIRLFVPKAKQGNSNAKKIVKDYQYERKAVDMKRFVDENMPNFVEKVAGLSDLEKFHDKAKRHGLPRALLFTSKAQTLSLTKFLSTEFRRRLLLAEIHPTKTNQKVLEQYGISPDQLPAVVVIPSNNSTLTDDDENGTETEDSWNDNEDDSSRWIWYDGDGFTRHKLQSFLSKHALKEKVFTKKKTEDERPSTPKQEEEKTKDQTKEEKQEKPPEKVKVGADGEL